MPSPSSNMSSYTSPPVSCRAGRNGNPSLSLLYSSDKELKEASKMEKGSRQGSVASVAAYIQVQGRCGTKKGRQEGVGSALGPLAHRCFYIFAGQVRPDLLVVEVAFDCDLLHMPSTHPPGVPVCSRSRAAAASFFWATSMRSAVPAILQLVTSLVTTVPAHRC